MKGEFKPALLPRLLKQVEAQKLTGVLAVNAQPVKVQVFVDQGRIVYAAGNQKGTRLADLILGRQLIPADRLQQLARLAQAEKKSLGVILAERRLISTDSMKGLIREQIQRAIFGLMKFGSGSYEFRAQKINLGALMVLHLPIDRLLSSSSDDDEEKAVLDEPTPPPPKQKKVTGQSLVITVLKDQTDLPPRLETVMKARKALNDDKSDFSELERILRTDQSLVARILKVANSAFYGMSGRVGSLQQATALLGYKTLTEIVTIAGTASFLKKPLKNYGLTARQVWHHSMAVAFGCRSLAGMVNPSMEEEAFITGLLHDAGKILMDSHMADCREAMDKLIGAGRQDIFRIEKQFLQIDHAEIAAALFQKWQFPEALITAVRYHHEPEISNDVEMAYIVNAADAIAKSHEQGENGYGEVYPVHGDIMEYLGLREEEVIMTLGEISEQVKQIVFD